MIVLKNTIFKEVIMIVKSRLYSSLLAIVFCISTFTIPIFVYSDSVTTTCADSASGNYVMYIDASGEQLYIPESEVTVVTAASTGTWTSGWYLVEGHVIIPTRIIIDGTVNLILADNAFLDIRGGIRLEQPNHLIIWGQSIPTDGWTYLDPPAVGRLLALAGAGSGGAATSGSNSAGIGSNHSPANQPAPIPAGTLTINGGRVEARGSNHGAGIGGGGNLTQAGIAVGGSGGTLNINGGVVRAIGGGQVQNSPGAGIGGGGGVGGLSRGGAGGIINIAGGYVYATGGSLIPASSAARSATGIGPGGQAAGSQHSEPAADITVTGDAIIRAVGGGVGVNEVMAIGGRVTSANQIAGVPSGSLTVTNGATLRLYLSNSLNNFDPIFSNAEIIAGNSYAVPYEGIFPCDICNEFPCECPDCDICDDAPTGSCCADCGAIYANCAGCAVCATCDECNEFPCECPDCNLILEDFGTANPGDDVYAVVDVDFNDVYEVTVFWNEYNDGEGRYLVYGVEFIVKEGSVIIILTGDFTEDLDVGTHTFLVTFLDEHEDVIDYTVLTLVIVADGNIESPETGVASLAIGVVALFTIGGLIFIIVKKAYKVKV